MKSPSSNQSPRFIVALRQTLLAELVEAVMTQGVSLLALTAPAGTGKTTLASALQQELVDRSMHVLRIGRGEGCRLDLRAVACQVLGKPEADFNVDDIEALFDVMTVRSVPGQKLVLIIDDAELLGTDALGYLRLLCSIAKEEMPQIVFVGRTSLWDASEHLSRADIRELITDRRELEPLSEIEARTFAEIASPECVFGEGAVDALVRHGNGSIGRIASLLVLARGCGDDEHPPRLAVAAIDAAVSRLDADTASDAGDGDTLAETPPVVTELTPTPGTSHTRRRLRFAPTLGAAMVMATAGLALYWQAFVHGDRMRAQAGSIHEMAATAAAAPIGAPRETQAPQADAVPADASTPAPAPATSPAQATVASSVDADAPTIGEFSPAPVRLPRIDQTWLLADILDDAAYSAAPATPVAPQETQTPQAADAVSADASTTAAAPMTPAAQASVASSFDADAPTIGEFSPVPVPPPRIGQTWLFADMLDEAAYSAAADVGSAEENNQGPMQNVPVSGPSDPTVTETPVQPVMQASEATPAIGPLAGNPPGVVVVQQEPIAPATPYHDDALPGASAPVLQAQAPASGTPLSDEAAAKASTAAADGVATPHTDLPGAPVATLDGKVVKATATVTVSTPDPSPLLSRGDTMLALGDIAAARLFYERAVTLGSARGATSLGKTYDPAFLASIRATGVTPNRDLAATLYRRGAELGDMEGTRRLAMLPSKR